MPSLKPLLIAAALFAALPALGADQWISLTTPHFELYILAGDKTAGEKKGRDALLSFEQVRTFVMQSAHAAWDQPIPVRIISFPSDKQFRPYAPANADTAYSSYSQSRDYFVMVDSDPDHLPVSLHQYVHLALQHSGLTLPVWLAEGWADVFSTLKSAGTQPAIGAAPKDYVQTLKSEKWLDFNALTSVNETSPNYHEKSRTGVFYAESWALVHMLYLGRDYRDSFAKLLAALNDGKPAAEGFQIAYNRTPAQVYSDLQAYVRQNALTANAVPAIFEKPAEDPVSTPVSDLDSGVMLADLQAVTNRRDQAKAAYDKLAKQYPGASVISESLGYLAWQEGDTDSARRYFEEALPGTKNPLMCYHLAMLYHDAGQGGDKLIAALSRAVSLKSDYAEARLQLGIAEFNRSNYPAAIAALAPIGRIAPDHAAALYGALANAYAQTGDFAAARKALETGRQWMKTDAEKQKADQLAQYLDSAR